jgi:hypothetical protein
MLIVMRQIAMRQMLIATMTTKAIRHHIACHAQSVTENPFTENLFRGTCETSLFHVFFFSKVF